MALCLECKADYLRHITVCPACGRPLEPDSTPEPAETRDFVPLMSGPYPEGISAAASLEAAGLETRLETMNFNIYFGTPLNVTVLVRGRDLDAARAALRRPSSRDA